MSFTVPRNVPRFDNTQRSYENSYWSSSARPAQNGNGMHGRIGGFFDNNKLPMYKDKPYSYASSRRRQAWFTQKRVWAGTLVLLTGLLFYLGAFSTSQETERGQTGGRLWNWIRRPAPATVDWNFRAESVKETFKLSWDGYEKHAWGKDEYYPIAKDGHNMTPKGLGWIIIDALDTLMVMNLTSRLVHARQWISTSLDYNQDQEVNTFETTIRMLGGLLSAHYLSKEYPNMAPVTEEGAGMPGHDLYLEKAADLADRLVGAFATGSGVPFASVNLQTGQGVRSHTDGGASSTAEAGTLQLEFKYLASLLGEKLYWEKAEKVIQVIDDNGMEDGLLPIFIYADTGTFREENIRLGSRGDSYYEYLIKQYLQTSKEEPIYLEMWKDALAGVRRHLIGYSKHSHFTILGERQEGLGKEFTPKMDHLVCFMPGTIALGATEGRNLAEARKSKVWSKKQEDDILLARELMKTCWGMYKATATGLAAEITHFEIDVPPRMAMDGQLHSAQIDFSDTSAEGSAWKSDYIIKHQDSHNLQRPETVESLFYMWRITGDVLYREWGWEMFRSFVNYTAVEDGGGFTSLSSANTVPPVQKDYMESFWLAETLKYFYLLFSPPELLPLDSIVINTEAHIFPRFKLHKPLKTGWTRKPRDAGGRIAGKEKTAPESERKSTTKYVTQSKHAVETKRAEKPVVTKLAQVVQNHAKQTP